MEDCDMGRHSVSKAGFSDDGRNEAVRCKQAYWFPDQKVKKGDSIWLYTRSSEPREQDSWNTGAKSTTYTFFWGLDTEVWNKGWEYIIIAEAAMWTGKPV